MDNSALALKCEDPEKGADDLLADVSEVRVIESDDSDIYVFFRNEMFAQYQKRDHFTRNVIIAQLFLCQKVPQKNLSQVFHLTVPYISHLVGRYRRWGSAGIEDNTRVRIANNQKIKGKVAAAIIKQLGVKKEDRPTYEAVAKQIKKKFGIQISADRIGGWWRKYPSENPAQSEANPQEKPSPVRLNAAEEIATEPDAESSPDVPLPIDAQNDKDNDEEGGVDEAWQPNAVAGSFILYAMLDKTQFLKPFFKHLKKTTDQGRQSIERVLLTLFFIHALRLKSIEQTKHLLAAHFGPLVLGPFCRQQSLRYAIDKITVHKKFDQATTEHYQSLGQHTDLGDDIYYVDGHFSCYYGKYAIPKGYDARKKQPARGRNTIYLHNSLGHNILFFESPTNTTLNVDIETLLEKMQTVYGEVKGKTLFFDRGGFSANCFKKIKDKEMYFTTYLKHRKKSAEVDESLFKECEAEVHGEIIKNRIYEKEQQSQAYGTLRTILFIGKRGKQIPVISTNLTLSGAAIVARLQKRWVEENGFKYMGEHFNIDLLTSYKTEQAPDKIMERKNSKRKEINALIASKKLELKGLKEAYASRLREVKDKDEVTIAKFEKQEEKLNLAIKHGELELGLLLLEKEKIPSQVESNLKDESVISCQKRRMFINLVKTMNYNCEKWLQLVFCQYHPKANETLSLIRHVLTQPGRIRQRGQILEVELERLDSATQARSLDSVLENLKENNHFNLPDGRKLVIWQAE